MYILSDLIDLTADDFLWGYLNRRIYIGTSQIHYSFSRTTFVPTDENLGPGYCVLFWEPTTGEIEVIFQRLCKGCKITPWNTLLTIKSFGILNFQSRSSRLMGEKFWVSTSKSSFFNFEIWTMVFSLENNKTLVLMWLIIPTHLFQIEKKEVEQTLG